MLPIGPLMIEHRLIERMVRLMKTETGRMRDSSNADVDFTEVAIDFLRTYVDRCHHGKEEEILFRELGKKELSEEHSDVMRALIKDHSFSRSMVDKLSEALGSYGRGEDDSLKDILSLLEVLVELYPTHIAKEDKSFFVPCMEYFTKEEQDAMLAEFWEFDRKMIHEKYQRVVEKLEVA